jgi:hypothetical protein
MIRGLDNYEQTAVAAVKATMGIVGGKRKIKSKDVLDMKKGKNIQKDAVVSRSRQNINQSPTIKSTIGISGGKKRNTIKSKDVLDMKKGKNIQIGGERVVGPYTNPADYTYIPSTGLPGGTPVKTDSDVLTAIRKCERTHYELAGQQQTGFSSYIYANTDSKYDMTKLRDCIGKQLYPAASGPGSYAKINPSTQRTANPGQIVTLDYTIPICTTAQNTRGVCPTGKWPDSNTSQGKQLWGGKRASRKKNPRSSTKRATIKKQMH